MIGAGDAFVAEPMSCTSSVTTRHSANRRPHRATATGAFAVTTRGDWEGLPTRADLALLDSPPGTTLR
ncbi:hypothetical protein [Streptomyces sp. NBC_01237]|uniref:hypothetical protein n=1 Tax=Streptomyces sp. NBC_01237 TaxID=2903790 RepID=UPI002DDB9C86|nr:hypothetical protein [Streptomyces sp. NBC_01237]WRZ77140.1 hypothetical protein OG251_00140 [Streptomyces sp. NBC_01237]